MKMRISMLAFAFSASQLYSQIAPDASAPLPGEIGSFFLSYSSGPAHKDVEVLPGCTTSAAYDCKIQLTGRVYLPAGTLTGTYPVIILLHGNHNTCGHNYNPPPPAGTGTDPAGLPGNPRIDAGTGSTKFAGTGTCTGANPIVVPSFRGYDYIGIPMASEGYVVVSMDANRGIGGLRGAPGVAGDVALIRARGVLVLKTLQMLNDWNINGGAAGTAPSLLQGHLDLTNVGLMGHSRGGEGMRAALSLFNGITPTPFSATASFATNPWPARIPGLNIRAIFEIAPTDTGMVDLPVTTPPHFTFFNVTGTVWNVLLPMCDGDVSMLKGVRAFDRAIMAPENPPIQKSTYTVWGANHNFFNTQWMVTDPFPFPAAPSIICRGTGNTAIYPLSPGSFSEELVATSSVRALFRGNVGVGTLPNAAANLTFNQNFNPPFGIPPKVLGLLPFPTRIDRGYSPPGFFTTFDDFTKAGFNSRAPTVPHVASNVTATYGNVPDHDPVISQAARISWTAAGADTFFQTSWTANGTPGMDITRSGFDTLDLRVSRQNSSDNAATTNFSISLVGANGVMTRSVLLNKYIDPNFAGANPAFKSNLTGPVGSSVELHPILQTVRIPLTDFGNFSFIGPQLHAVRLTFDQTAKGKIYVTNIRLSSQIGGGVTDYPPHPELAGLVPEANNLVAETNAEITVPPTVHACRVVSVTSERDAPELGGVDGFRILVQSTTEPFPVRDSLLTMVIGRGDAPPLSEALTVIVGDEPMVENEEIFTLTTSQYLNLPPGAHVILQFDDTPQPSDYWDCGLLR